MSMEVRMFTVGPVQENTFLINREGSDRALIVDPGEEPAVSAAREALEETGVVIRVDRLASTSVMSEVVYDNGDRASYLDLTFACTWISGEEYVADDESTDVRWWPVDDLPPMSDSMSQRVAAAAVHAIRRTLHPSRSGPARCSMAPMPWASSTWARIPRRFRSP